MRLSVLIVGCWLAAAGSWAAPVEKVSVNPEAMNLLHAGSVEEMKAANARTKAEGIAGLEKAVALFAQAARVAPEFYKAQALWADGLAQLARLSDADLARSREFVKQARERFAVASRCTGVTSDMYSQWYGLLSFEVDSLTKTADDRNAVRREEQRVLTEGIAHAMFSFERGTLERELGYCLVLQARDTADATQQRELFTQALAHFAEAGKVSRLQNDVVLAGVWGMALLDFSKLTHDPSLVAQAIERLETARKLDPGRAATEYNLACAYAVLDKPGEALACLKNCITYNSSRELLDSIRTDHDFDRLRSAPEYQALFQPRLVKPGPVELMNMAQALAREGQDSSDDAVAVNKLEQAVELYRRAVQQQPDYFPASSMWARCLYAMARHTVEPYRRRAILLDASERFALAAKSPEVDWTLLYAWATMLNLQSTKAASNDQERRDAYASARKAYESALSLTKFASDRARVERDMATCLVNYADASADSKQKISLYKDAIAHFVGSAPRRGEPVDAHSNILWGVALLKLGQLSHDRLLIRQSIERLQTAIDHDPRDAEARYNLACAFIAINQPDVALTHLRACFENDPSRAFYNNARTDPDMKPLQGLPGYRELFTDVESAAPKTEKPPTLSGR